VGHYRPWTIDPSAAQAHPNGRGEINAFVPDLALRRAALKGATSSPYLFSGTERGVSDQGRYDKRQKAPRLWDRTPDAVLTVGS